jgi:hypothetical protein
MTGKYLATKGVWQSMGLSHMVKITFQQSLVAFSLLIIKAFSKPQKARFYPQVLKYSILPAKRSPTFSLASDEHSPTFSMVSEDGYALTVSVMPAQNPSMATGSHPSSATLLSLPNETLLEIADFIQSPNNLSGLVRTNRFFYRLLKDRLYRLPPSADALKNSILRDNTAALKCFLSHGLCVNTKISLYTWKGPLPAASAYQFEICSLVMAAYLSGKYAVVRLLLQSGANLTIRRDLSVQTRPPVSQPINGFVVQSLVG